MEFAEKIKSFMKSVFFAGVAIVLLNACAGEPPPPPPIIQNPLTLQEIAPLPRQAVVAAREVVQEFEPVYAVYRIIEVSEVNGVQRTFLVRIGNNRTGISIGVTGDIAEDEGFQKIIGNYKIAEIYGDFFRCDIEELDYRIGANAFIRIQTGEQLKAETTP
jgi:hypothetical protein